MKSGFEPTANGVWGKVVFGLLALILAVSLFADYASVADHFEWLRMTVWEVRAACRDPATQWMVVLCLLSYFVTFRVLEGRRNAPSENTENAPTHASRNTSSARPVRPATAARAKAMALLAFLRGKVRQPEFWLSVFLVLALLRYASDYAAAAKSLQLVVLLAGIVFGQAAAVRARGIFRPPATVASAEGGTETSVRRLLGLLLFLLTVAVFWQREAGLRYEYRGIARWTGPWDNPNLYGLLMGTGCVVAVGLLVSHLRDCGKGFGGLDMQRGKARMWLPTLLYLVAGAVCGLGLVKSYSRGAWLGTACGLAFLVWQTVARLALVRSAARAAGEEESFSTRKRCQVLFSAGISWLHRHRISVVVLVLSAVVLLFWEFRYTQAPLVRRVFSVGNVNDFSWRNRVTAWQGSVRMMLRHPFVGVGWGKVEQRFREDFRPERLEETAAVQLNDYLTLANSAGIPALGCLLACFGFTLGCGLRAGSQGLRCAPDPSSPSLPSACRGAALLLLVGFWFDGGLFKLPTSLVFWLLLGLSQVCAPQDAREVEQCAATTLTGVANASRRRRAGVVSWLAACLAALAVGRTALHWIAPQLAVTARTSEVARRFLLSPDEIPDFDHLIASANWQRQKLQALLEHAQLAHYNRSLVKWRLEDESYRRFVLTPEIAPAFDGARRWRRVLWEYFYPRIRRAENPVEAAQIILTVLRQRVVVSGASHPLRDVAAIWEQQAADDQGFAALCVAALRSVGIPARLFSPSRAEFCTGSEWRPCEPAAPAPH